MTYSDTEWWAMGRARELALLGPRGVNPQVGAVVLSPSGEVLAEGWHRGAGNPHAEVEALSHLSPDQARGATMVVTLEPCNHTGRTGPCAVALIEAGVARVVYAVADPAEPSAGGAERLRAHGIDVEGGVRADEVTEMLDSWLTVVRLGRPFVTVKWAQSLDGRAAANDGTSKWITGPDARADVHRRRAEADAIVVGTGTVLADDPALTARLPDGELAASQPLPVVIGTRPVAPEAALRRHPRGLVETRTRELRVVLDSLREQAERVRRGRADARQRLHPRRTRRPDPHLRRPGPDRRRTNGDRRHRSRHDGGGPAPRPHRHRTTGRRRAGDHRAGARS